MFTIADITQLREFIAVEEEPARVLDRLDGYLAGMQFVAESRQRETDARSERAVKAVSKARRGRPPGAKNLPRNGVPVRVGTPLDEGDESDE